MANCKIDKGFAFDCDAVPQGGIQPFMILVNQEDWLAATITVDTGVTENITDITLTGTGTQGYLVEVPKSGSLLATSPYRAITGADGYDHTVDFRAYDTSELCRITLEKLRFSKVVALIPRNDGTSLVYGANPNSSVGLRISDTQENASDPDTGGTIQAVIKTPDDDPPEIQLPYVVADTFDIKDLLTPVP